MISYSWSVQTQAVELKQVLLDHGYRIWMDIENMSKCDGIKQIATNYMYQGHVQ